MDKSRNVSDLKSGMYVSHSLFNNIPLNQVKVENYKNYLQANGIDIDNDLQPISNNSILGFDEYSQGLDDSFKKAGTDTDEHILEWNSTFRDRVNEQASKYQSILQKRADLSKQTQRDSENLGATGHSGDVSPQITQSQPYSSGAGQTTYAPPIHHSSPSPQASTEGSQSYNDDSRIQTNLVPIGKGGSVPTYTQANDPQIYQGGRPYVVDAEDLQSSSILNKNQSDKGILA